MSKKKITLPTRDDEAELESVIENMPEVVEFCGRKRKVYWLKRGTIRKITSIMNKKGNDDKVSCQAAAAILLNGYWKIKLLWWWRWRWYYYVRQWGDDELTPLIVAGKKKIPAKEYLAATILLTAMKDTIMQMTKEEANTFLREPLTDKSGKSAKATLG